MQHEHRHCRIELAVLGGQFPEVAFAELHVPQRRQPLARCRQHRRLAVDRHHTRDIWRDALGGLPGAAPEISHRPLGVEQRQQRIGTEVIAEQRAPHLVPLAAHAPEERAA